MDFSRLSVDDKLTLMLAHGYAGLQKAAELRNRQKKASAVANALIPATLDALIDADFISKEARAKATRDFQDPSYCLKFLKKMAEVGIPKDRVHAYEFGTPVKQASARSAYMDYDPSGMKESDRIWFESDF